MTTSPPVFRNTELKLGISVMNSHPEAGDITAQIQIFSDVGFDTFFLSCGVTSNFDRIPLWAEAAHRAGIIFEAVHAPTDGVNALWLPVETVETASYMERTQRILTFCAEGGVSKLVLHTAYGQPPPVSPIGLSRFSTLENFAARCGVSLCYENADVAEHLMAAVQNASAEHGFCHDTGHNLCYTPKTDYLSVCGKKLLYTHLHDNRGGADEHLLPYDGLRDWTAYAAQLSEIGYRGTLNAELSCSWRDDYRAMPYAAFLKTAHGRLRRLRDGLSAVASIAVSN